MNNRNSIMEKELYKARRQFLQLTGAGLVGALLPQQTEATEKYREKFAVLKENSRLDIGDSGKEIIEKAYRLGHKYEGKYGGCCRCTVAAVQNAIEFIPVNEDVFRTACCLDGGATPTGMQNCGSFTGSGIIIGYVCGTSPFQDTRLSHKLIHEVYERFRQAYKTVLCKDVRENGQANCPEIVGKAARWTTETILRQFTNYDGK